MEKKRIFTKKRLLLCGLFLLVLAIGLVFVYRSQNPTLLGLKKHLKYDILRMPTAHQAEETVGLGRLEKSRFYENGTEIPVSQYHEYSADYDNKRIYYTADRSRLVNYPDGYQIDLPKDLQLDVSRSATVVEGESDECAVTVSFEYCPYTAPHEEMTEGLAAIAPWYEWEDGVDQYIGYYQCRFLWSEQWQQENRVSVTRPEPITAGDYRGILFHAVIEDVPEDKYDAYSYIYIHLDGQDFLRLVVRYRSENTALRDSLAGLMASFRTFDRLGSAVNTLDFYPVEPESWSQETLDLYHAITDSTELRWGIYTTDIYGEGVEKTIPELEEKLGYQFRTILSYVHYTHDFPTAFMQENWDSGRIVELTYQLTTNNNENMFGYSPMLDLYRGQGLEPIREFAKKAKEFGHPFLFRLCNEMNSDWTSYSGVVNMADPNLYIEVYRTIYQIFEEEGVDNCIWIYNPNDRNAPPNKWNDAVNYYPGNDCVQMIGVTGYNNGTYYTQWAEEWREFDTIYDHIQNLYGDMFGAFPWIITEFASSSVGGDKAAWIDHMFDTIGNYPNIKLAVWFSSADWDADGNVARPYWLDETEETTDAFRRGLANYADTPWPMVE